MKVSLYIFQSYLALLLFFSTCLAEVVFLQETSPGQYMQTGSEEFQKLFPLDHPGMKKAFQAYDSAQRYAHKASIQNSKSIPLLGFQPRDLYISLDNSDWAYNEMYGKDIRVTDHSGRSRDLRSVPLTRIGRNMPDLSNRNRMGEVLAHETGHAVMNALYGGKHMPSCSGGSHNHDSIKDPQFALVEGFGEYFGAATFGDRMIPRSYKNRNQTDLNASEGFVASVLLAIDQKFGQEGVFEIFSETTPKSIGQFLEAYIRKFPDTMLEVFEIMQTHSGKQWPTEAFLKALNEGTLSSLDLDGDGQLYPPKAIEPLIPKKELAQIEYDRALEELKIVDSYRKSLLSDVNRMSLFESTIYAYFPPSPWREGILNQVLGEKNQALALYEKSDELRWQTEKELSRAKSDLDYWLEGENPTGPIPTLETGGNIIRNGDPGDN